MAAPGQGHVRNETSETIEVGMLTIEIERRSPVQVVGLRGELGIDEAPTLQAEFERALDSGSRGYEVDLSRLEFIDSTGLACLVTRSAMPARGASSRRCFAEPTGT